MRRVLTATLVILALAAGPALAARKSAPANLDTVVVYLKLSDGGSGAEGESFALYAVEDRVEAALKGGLGVLEGHQIGQGYFTIFTHGRDSAAMVKAIAPALADAPIQDGSYLVRKAAKAKTPPIRIDLPPSKAAPWNSEPAGFTGP